VLAIIWLIRQRSTGLDDVVRYPCRQCGYDLRASKSRCPECGAAIPRRTNDYFPLRDDWPTTPVEPRVQSPEETPLVIRTTANSMEAQLIHDQFNARGIACWISEQPQAELIGYTPRTAAESVITIWSGDEAVGRDLLNRLLQHDPNRRRPK
jgi:hypothetical protein